MDITLSVDAETVETARRVARTMNKSLDQMVCEYLEQLARRDQAARDIAAFAALAADHEGRSPENRRWRRDEVYDREVSR